MGDDAGQVEGHWPEGEPSSFVAVNRLFDAIQIDEKRAGTNPNDAIPFTGTHGHYLKADPRLWRCDWQGFSLWQGN
jgi:hypothetical protein